MHSGFLYEKPGSRATRYELVVAVSGVQNGPVSRVPHSVARGAGEGNYIRAHCRQWKQDAHCHGDEGACTGAQFTGHGELELDGGRPQEGGGEESHATQGGEGRALACVALQEHGTQSYGGNGTQYSKGDEH